MEINGMAHVILTVSNFEVCAAFYEPLLHLFGMQTVMRFDGYLYCVGGRTALGIAAADPAYRDERFVQQRVGLQHLCFRARSRADVDACHAFLVERGATIVHPPQEDNWAPGYYSLLFEARPLARPSATETDGKADRLSEMIQPDAPFSAMRSGSRTGAAKASNPAPGFGS